MIKNTIAVAVILLILAIVAIIIMKYQIEGETKMPFTLSKITIVSTAEGTSHSEAVEKWNLEVIQNNDIYFTIEKNEDYTKEEMIEAIKIENIQVIKEPQVGKIEAYMPNSMEGRTFQNTEEYKIEERKLSYKGGSKTNLKTLEIGNQGGMIAIRIANTGLGNYISNEDMEITHDGSLISKIGYQNEEILFQISFDFIIELKNKSYKTTIQLDLPCSNILEEGTGNKEITDTKQFIFKRM